MRALADGAGAVTDTYDYSAYGELLSQTGSSTNAYLYTGQQFDASAGLYSLRARYYDPRVGRFLGRDPAEIDPLDARQLNRYVYVGDNPVNLEDPTGLLAVEYETQSQQSLEEAQSLKWVVYPAWEVYRTPWYIYILRALGVTVAVGGPLACGLLCPGPVPLPQPQPVPEAPPVPRPETQPKPQPQETPPPPEATETPEPRLRMIYRGVKGSRIIAGQYWNYPDLRPSEFDFGNQPDGLSTFELPFLNIPGSNLRNGYLYPFVVTVATSSAQENTPYPISVPGCRASYTPMYAPGHWSIRCGGGTSQETRRILSEFARRPENRTSTILNPYYSGVPEDRRFEWPD